jgi:hypothetical protein
MKSFYKLNKLFNENIGQLYEGTNHIELTKAGKSAIGRYINLIKNDNILKKEYTLFSQLGEGVSKTLKESKEMTSDYVNSIEKMFEGVNRAEIVKSNNKLYEFICGLGKEGLELSPINGDEFDYNSNEFDEEMLDDENEMYNEAKLANAAEYIIYESKDKNLLKYVEMKSRTASNLKLVQETVECHYKDLIANFNKKYRGKLTTEELGIINDIIVNNNPESQKNMLKEYQKKCVDKINKILAETDDLELKEKFLILKEKAMFNEKYSQNIGKLYEIRRVVDEIIEENDNESDEDGEKETD